MSQPQPRLTAEFGAKSSAGNFPLLVNQGERFWDALEDHTEAWDGPRAFGQAFGWVRAASAQPQEQSAHLAPAIPSSLCCLPALNCPKMFSAAHCPTRDNILGETLTPCTS